jgi:hypothetical protein
MIKIIKKILKAITSPERPIPPAHEKLPITPGPPPKNVDKMRDKIVMDMYFYRYY